MAQFELRPTSGEEIRIRALLEDLADYHTGVYPKSPLALAVWFKKDLKNQEQNLLELFSAIPQEGFIPSRFSLFWKSDSDSPPFVNLYAASVAYFLKLMSAYPEQTAPYLDHFEVIYFDKTLLPQEILEAFKVITEPSDLMKGWFISENEYSKSKNIQSLLSLHGHTKPELALVKTKESEDFENCRGILHIEVGQKWLPLSPEGIQPYAYYNDLQNGHPVYFLFEGGSLYQALKFEVKTIPDFAGRLLGRATNDRYPEVYLRAVHPSTKPTA